MSEGNKPRTKKPNQVQAQEALKLLRKIKLEFEDFDNCYPGLLPSHLTFIQQALVCPKENYRMKDKHEARGGCLDRRCLGRERDRNNLRNATKQKRYGNKYLQIYLLSPGKKLEL